MTVTEAQAKQTLQALIKKYHALTADERKTMSEASVVRQFIDILLRDVLGWPIEDPARYRYEQVTQAGRPDMMLTPEAGGTIFVEAKRFGVIKELEQARKTISGIVTPGQMSLPGMAVDRTPEEQQAINYAFANNGTWAILSNFEKLRLFNARRDWLVLSFETPQAYLDDFDYLWELAYHNVIHGSLDRLSNQRVTADIDTEYLNFINEWRQKLAQDIVQHQAENQWAFTPDGQIDLPTLRSVVQRIIDRLVIIRFAEDHLVIPPGTLRGFYELRQQNPYADLDSMLDNLFRRFDKAHNSALFAKGLADEAAFSDEALIGLLTKLYEARYRSMSADIMGNTYEQYLGKTLVRRNGSIATADNLETRKKQGSYYTPQVIVRYIVDNSLGRYLYATENGQPDGQPIPGETRQTSADIHDLRVLDSACGSGSFLIYAYEVLNTFYESERARLEAERQRRFDELTASGITDPMELQIQLAAYKTELERIHNPARLILETHLYGVDLDPQAAEIAVVNLMMRGMERRHVDKRLPLILNQNVKVGNALVGSRYDDPRLLEHAEQIAALRRLRAALIRESHDTPEHHQIIQDLTDQTATLAAALDTPLAGNFTDLQTVRPFHWGAEFPEAFFDKDGKLLDKPGFTIIFGNPPWEIIKPSAREFFASRFEEGFWDEHSREEADRVIEKILNNTPALAREWEDYQRSNTETTAYYQSSDDYRWQGQGHATTFKLFLERMCHLLQDKGQLGYVIPSGIYSDLGTQPLREMLFSHGQLEYLLSFANNKKLFSDIHSSFKFVLLGFRNEKKNSPIPVLFRVTVDAAVSADEFVEIVQNTQNFAYVTLDEIRRFSPNNLTILEFKDRLDASITSLIFANSPLLSDKIDGVWSIDLAREFHMGDDRQAFSTTVKGWPLYEGRMIDQFDHRIAYWVSGHGRTAVWHYSLDPERFSDNYPWRAQYYIDSNIALERQIRVYGKPKWRIGICKVTAPTNHRTVVASMLPMTCGVGDAINTATVLFARDETSISLYILSVLNSLVFDYVVRFKVKLNLNHFILTETPVPRLTPSNPYFDAIVPRAARLTCTRAEFADLWQSVMGEAWDESKGATDPAERQRLRDEIDAIVAHLYDLSREDFDHILGTFPLVFPDTDAGRAKRYALLAVFDQWAGKLNS